MMWRSHDPIRYYIINVDELETLRFNGQKNGRRSRILYSRPSRWKVFLSGFLCLSDSLAFVRLPDSIVNSFLNFRIAAFRIDENTIQINAHRVKLEPWTLWNVCKFCIEGIQYGTFQRFWKWIW